MAGRHSTMTNARVASHTFGLSSHPSSQRALASHHNVIGPFIARLRNQRGWTQEQVVARLQIAGYPITRDIVANIELRRTSTTDTYAQAFARIFNVCIAQLFPELQAREIVGVASPRTRARRRRKAHRRRIRRLRKGRTKTRSRRRR